MGHARQRRVLAALLVDAGQVVSASALEERVWGERVPRRGRETLYGYLSRLRQALTPWGSELVREQGGYRLVVAMEAVDLHRFRDLVARARSVNAAERAAALWEEALGLWRGEAFAGADTPWFNTQRDVLETERLAAQMDLADVRLRLGQHARVLAECSSRAEAYPLDERVAGQLMLALFRCGRQAEALACYTALRKRLAKELGTDPGAEVQHVHQAILRGESARPAASGTQPPAETGPGRAVPAQLPLEVRGFTGRREELTRLDRILATAAEGPAAVVVSAVSGTAGVGKTALAVHWAHRVADRFPDGQLYVNLRGFDPWGAAVTPDQAVRGFLDALGVPARQVPVDLQARVGLYRSLLAGQRVLVVLDNARDADQVRPLLPGSPGCLALVTSRNRLAGLVATEGAHPLALDLLSPAEARDLLARRLGEERVAAEPDAAQEIITRCARLPLALAIATARAATHPGFPLSAVAEELRDNHGSLDAFDGGDLTTDARAVFSWSDQALSTPAARLFHLLGLHSGPDISAPAAAALAGLPLRPTRGLLIELTRAHLLTEHTPGRYTLHDLLRVYAAERVLAQETPPERDHAAERLLTWYLHTADAIHPFLTPNRRRVPLDPLPASCHPLAFSAHDQALNWCDSERPNLVAAVHHAVAVGRPGIAWRMAAVLWGFFYLRGHLHDWLDTTRTALDAARATHDRIGEAWSLGDAASALTQIHRFDEAIDHFRQAMALCRELGDVSGRCQAMVNLGYAYRQIGQPDRSVEYCRRALAIHAMSEARIRKGNVLFNLGDSYQQLGRFDDAIDCLEQALTVLRAEGDRWGEGVALDLLGTVHHRLRRHDDAITYYHQALDTHTNSGYWRGEAHTLGNLGDVHLAVGATDTAREAWQRALAILDDPDHPDTAQLRTKLNTLT
ncbi:BTAD domain-containing putative transcriptional regulator [Streptomyces sp. NPDC058697]|uniref:AfsR/SARP family transcriptional regulator n=1 Tax=Streptomyces sp. NPDC058697 TaxID=3346605 RepID=UPI003666B55A